MMVKQEAFFQFLPNHLANEGSINVEFLGYFGL